MSEMLSYKYVPVLPCKCDIVIPTVNNCAFKMGLECRFNSVSWNNADSKLEHTYFSCILFYFAYLIDLHVY
jgi:hypothetical protein